MTLHSFRTRQALADLEMVIGSTTPDDPTALAFCAQPEAAFPAIGQLLWQALSGHVYDQHLIDLWLQRQTDLRAAPPPVRAALMNGFQRLRNQRLLSEDCAPADAELVTHPRASLKPLLITLARQMTLREIDHVSRADYGYKADQHREALLTLLADPDLAYPADERWFPAEVVELVSHAPSAPGYFPAWRSCF